jgi:hypothetical protein
MNTNFTVFFDNGGNVTLNVGDYAHMHDCGTDAAIDVAILLGGAELANGMGMMQMRCLMLTRLILATEDIKSTQDARLKCR